MQGPIKDESLVGRDEMNLAEFPITLLSDRASKAVKTLTFEGAHGKLTITGSDDLGLPTAPDADVIVALIQLTKIRNNFTDPSVTFSRYELLKLLGWDDHSRSYRRLDDSLRRWVGVTLRYDRCWWDNALKCRIDANFHIMESVVLIDQEVRRTLRARQQSLPLSNFTWGKIFFTSCTNDNIKKIDLTTYFALRSAVSKRLYRLMDKRFYVRDDWTFDLRELAFNHVGMSRNYTAAKLKEKLKPALEELEAIGFLRTMTPEERYANVGKGAWRVRLAHQTNRTKRVEVETSAQATTPEQELILRGVTPSTARDLVQEFPEDRIRAQIERVDWVREKKPKKVADAGAFLVAAIRNDYAAPSGFESRGDRAIREAADEARRLQDQDRRQHEVKSKAREREEEAKVRQFWERLSEDERARIDVEALENADPATRAGCVDGPKSVRRMLVNAIRDAHIRQLLGLPTARA